jgi:AcrR family transcriptional regulator
MTRVESEVASDRGGRLSIPVAGAARSKAPSRRTGKERLLRTAERLFAERGIGEVSLRQISAAAENGNNSAVLYHFGSKEKLVQAIVEDRLSWLNSRREVLVQQRNPHDLRTWVECFAIPIMELAEQPGSHYLTFVAQVRTYGNYSFDCLPEPFHSLTFRFIDHLRALLPGLPEPIRTIRLSHALMICVLASSDRERARARKTPLMPYAVHARDLVDGLVGFLTAPVSEEALQALEGVTIPLSPPVALP